MNLNSASIRSRLLGFGFVCGGLILGIFVTTRWSDAKVSRAYQSIDAAQQTIQAATDAITEAGRFKDDVNALAQEVMELRVREKTYLQFRRLELKTRFDELAGTLTKDRADALQRAGLAAPLQEYGRTFAERVRLQTEHDQLRSAMVEPLQVSEARLSKIQNTIEGKQSQLQMEGGTLRGDEAEMLNVARDCKIVFLKLLNLQQQFLATGDAQYIEQYKKLATGEAQSGIRSLREFAAALGDTNLIASGKAIGASLDSFLKDIEKSLANSGREKALESQLDDTGATMLRIASEQLAGANRRVRDQQAQAQNAAQQMAAVRASVGPVKRQANLVLLLVTLIAMGLGTAANLLVIRSVNRSLNNAINTLTRTAGQIIGAAGQVAASSHSLADGASRQAAAVEETSASLEQMAAMTQRNTGNAQNAKEAATATRTKTAAGVQDTREMDAAMAGIRSAAAEMGQTMNGIKAASGDVSRIIKTIDEIAFQTNILALNAAVEAARAGEAGMGFAVVADEVRSLAQRSAGAARETASMIEASIQRSDEGVAVTQKVNSAVEQIADRARQLGVRLEETLTSVQQVDEQVGQIAGASVEQSQGVAAVTRAIQDMEKVTQANAAVAEQTAGAAEELNGQADVLTNTVTALQSLVTGQRSGASAGRDSAPVSARFAAAAEPVDESAASDPAESVPMAAAAALTSKG